MPRNYQRKTRRASWSDADLSAALEAVRSTGISVRQAGRTWGISHPVLLRHLHGRVHKPGRKILGSKTVLLPETEAALKQRLVAELEAAGEALTMTRLRRFVFDDCERHGVSHHFVCGMAGLDWAAGFLRRHPDISVRRGRGASKEAPVEKEPSTEWEPPTQIGQQVVRGDFFGGWGFYGADNFFAIGR